MQLNFLIYRFNFTNLKNMFEGEDPLLAGGGKKYKNRNEMKKKLAKELEPATFESLGGNPLFGVDSKGKQKLMKNPTKLQMVEALVDSMNPKIEDKGGEEQSSSTKELEKKLKDKKDYN